MCDYCGGICDETKLECQKLNFCFGVNNVIMCVCQFIWLISNYLADAMREGEDKNFSGCEN